MSKVTRRDCLAEELVRPTTNAGLWLDKYIRDQVRSSDARASLVEQVAAMRQPGCYSDWFKRWEQCLLGYGASCRRATVTGRMAVGLGEDSVLETSIMLHHTLGVPCIPGTALKGLASSFARQRLGDDWRPGAASRAHSIMFGDTDSAGYVTFFDAMPVPGTSRLFPDVMTVHHANYYQTGNVPPADWDGPNPVPFLSADGAYLIALAGPEDRLIELETLNGPTTILRGQIDNDGIMQAAALTCRYAHVPPDQSVRISVIRPKGETETLTVEGEIAGK